jgi:hypothetical protein
MPETPRFECRLFYSATLQNRPGRIAVCTRILRWARSLLDRLPDAEAITSYASSSGSVTPSASGTRSGDAVVCAWSEGIAELGTV